MATKAKAYGDIVVSSNLIETVMSQMEIAAAKRAICVEMVRTEFAAYLKAEYSDGEIDARIFVQGDPSYNPRHTDYKIIAKELYPMGVSKDVLGKFFDVTGAAVYNWVR